jgi:hypothetical protein
MKEDVTKHPQCIPWDLSSDYGTQMLSHLPKNTHETARFDLNAAAWASTMLMSCMGIQVLRDPPPTLSHGG